jgi:uncharacterized spore protein YtfJ
MRIFDQVKDVVGGTAIFGEPYVKDGLTVIPTVKVSVGAGGGGDGAGAERPGGSGFGLDARPVGALIIRGEEVSWLPAIDVNRIVMMSQLLALIAILSWRSVAMARGKRR